VLQPKSGEIRTTKPYILRSFIVCAFRLILLARLNERIQDGRDMRHKAYTGKHKFKFLVGTAQHTKTTHNLKNCYRPKGQSPQAGWISRQSEGAHIKSWSKILTY